MRNIHNLNELLLGVVIALDSFTELIKLMSNIDHIIILRKLLRNHNLQIGL